MKNAFFSFIKKITPYWLRYQPSCILCLTTVKQSKQAICKDCLNDLPIILQGCKRCNLPIPYIGICGQCLKSPPHFNTIIAPYRYDFPIAQLITQFKYQSQWPIGYLLASLLCDELLKAYQHHLKKPDLLISVPLSKQRMRERSFNQADMLAQWLSKKLQIPAEYKLLTRTVHTQPQQQLTAKKRLQNLKNAFTLNPTIDVTDLHLAIVDDVITTGVTANTLAQLLYSKGAKCVDIYAIARTPKSFK